MDGLPLAAFEANSQIILAIVSALGAGGIVAAVLNFYQNKRREGVANSPGSVVFERQDQILVNLQQTVSAQAQMIATMGRDISAMRDALHIKDEEVHELRTRLRAAQERGAEMEYQLEEERVKRGGLEDELHKALAQLATFMHPGSTA